MTPIPKNVIKVTHSTPKPKSPTKAVEKVGSPTKVVATPTRKSSRVPKKINLEDFVDADDVEKEWNDDLENDRIVVDIDPQDVMPEEDKSMTLVKISSTKGKGTKFTPIRSKPVSSSGTKIVLPPQTLNAASSR